MLRVGLLIFSWAFSIFFLSISILGALTGDIAPALGLCVMGVALFPNIKKIGSVAMNGWSRGLGFALGLIIFSTNIPTTETPQVNELPQPQYFSSAISQIPSSTTGAEVFPVMRVIDGDTITVQTPQREEKVRIIGLDAPEMSPLECFGNESLAGLSALIAGKSVILNSEYSDDRDSFGRLLRYVSLGEQDIGAAMIRQGYATSYRKYPHPRMESYNVIEAIAQENDAGLWGACKKQTATSSKTATAASSVQIVNAATQSSVGSTQCAIKGNVNSKKEKIYHLPGCGSYQKTLVRPEEGDRWFCTEEEARIAGFRKAGNC